MNALIIDGTRGFGKEISNQLLDSWYDLVTVGRFVSGYKNQPHYSCDVGDLDTWQKTLQKINSYHTLIPNS